MSSDPTNDSRSADVKQFRASHLRFGWWALVVFLSMGLVLESLHGFKVAWYLDVAASTRRHMWTLAHAHGTLLSLVNIAAAVTISDTAGWTARKLAFVSHALNAANVLLPLGFFLGGCFIHGGDPGLGVLLVPPGGLLLVLAAVGIARSCRGTDS